MDTIKQSMIYGLYIRLSLWLRRQWEESRAVGWLTGQKSPSGGAASRVGGWLRGLLVRLFHVLRLDKLLKGSIFLHPMAFAACAMVLAPLLPTMVSLGLAGASLGSLVLCLGAQPELTLPKNPLGRYVVLYAAVYLYATFSSVSRAESLFSGLLTVLFVLLFLVIAAWEPKEGQLRKLLFCLVAAGVAVSLYGFCQVIFPSQFENAWVDEEMFTEISIRVYSTLENPNVLGEYFLLIIPLGAAMCLTAEGWRKKLLYGMACGIMVVCLVLTYSRGCYLGLLLAAAVFLVLLDRRFLILGIVAVALSPMYLPQSVLERFTSIGDMGDSSTSYRVSIWLGTIAMLKDYWFSGVGPGVGAFNLVYPRYAYNAVTAPHSHNLFLQILCDMGICGLVIFLLLLIAALRMLCTALRQEKDPKAKIFQIAVIAAMTGFMVQSMTDYTFYNYRVMLEFWGILALSVPICRMGRKAGVGSEVSP